MATYNEPLILTSAPGAPTSSVNKTTVDRPLTMEEWNTLAIGKPKGKATPLPVLHNKEFRAGTRPKLKKGSPSLVSKEDVAAWAPEVDSVFQSVLGRNAGAVGHQYFTYDLMADTGALMEDYGYSFPKSKEMALINMATNAGFSTEGINFSKSGVANVSPLATGAGTWNPSNNPEAFNSPFKPGQQLVTKPDGTRTLEPIPKTETSPGGQPPAGQSPTVPYTSVPLNQQPMQPVVYGGGGSNTTVVTGQGPQAKTAADALKIMPQNPVVLAGGNRQDYSRQERKGGMGPIPGPRVGGGGVNIFG